MPQSKRQSALILGGLLLACYAVAAVGGLSTASAIDAWYSTLRRPAWTPPSWVFGPVWTALYGLMAVSAWRSSRHEASVERTRALRWFWIQLGLNALWSPVFFGLRLPWPAVAIIAAMLAAIVVWLRATWRLDRPAGWMIAPYLAWVS